MGLRRIIMGVLEEDRDLHMDERVALASNPSTPPEVLRRLAGDEHWMVIARDGRVSVQYDHSTSSTAFA